MSKSVSSAELARLFGISRQAIYKASKAGRIKPVGKDKRGRPLFDIDICKKVLMVDAAQTTRSSGFAGGRPPKKTSQSHSARSHSVRSTSHVPMNEINPDVDNYNKAKVRKLETDAQIAALKLQEQSGELISKEAVRQQGAELGAIMLGVLQAWPARLAPELASMKKADEHDFNVLLTREVNSLIIEIRKRCGVEE